MLPLGRPRKCIPPAWGAFFLLVDLLVFLSGFDFMVVFTYVIT